MYHLGQCPYKDANARSFLACGTDLLSIELICTITPKNKPGITATVYE